MSNIVVLGGGISGLSSAVNILENVKGANVTLISECFTPQTTGDVAAGFCSPHLIEDTPLHLQRHWFKSTLNHLKSLAITEKSNDYGISLVSGFTLFTKPEEDPFWKDLVIGFRHLSDEEKKLFPNIEIMTGWFYSTFMCECQYYLPYLTSRFLSGGGIVIQNKIEDLSELADNYDVIINCCGLSARDLVKDSTLYPIRGQLMKVEAPWIKNYYNLDEDCYILPQQNFIILGGTYQINDYDLIPRKEDHDGIFERCCKMISTLKECKIIEDKVGLRPVRKTIRLEKDQPVKGYKKYAEVVHNYGHGGSGITLHWGCAQDVASIVSEIAQKSKL